MKESHYDLDWGYCPSYHHEAVLFGCRGTGATICALLRGATRFTEIAEQIPEMSDKMLASRLRELEEEGVVQRSVDPGGPRRLLADRRRGRICTARCGPSLIGLTYRRPRRNPTTGQSAPKRSATGHSRRTGRASKRSPVEPIDSNRGPSWEPDAGQTRDIGIGRCRHDRLDPALRSAVRPPPAGDSARPTSCAGNLRR